MEQDPLARARQPEEAWGLAGGDSRRRIATRARIRISPSGPDWAEAFGETVQARAQAPGAAGAAAGLEGNAKQTCNLSRHVRRKKMPWGDRTGPMGWGPMTGRGFGFCAGNDQPGCYAGPGGGRGLGRGRGRGFGPGRGFGRRGWFGAWPPAQTYQAAPPAAGMAVEQEKEMLKREAHNLKEAMTRLEQRLQELEDQTS